MFKWIFKLLLKILLCVAILAGLLMLLFNWPVKSKNDKMKFQLSFSQIYANSLGLDWHKVYQASLRELQPEKIRISAYWTEIEKTPSEYDWTDLDWMIKKAKENQTKILLTFGIKAPRWPECYIPKFYQSNKAERETALLRFEKKLLKRYKGEKNIIMWQVENEPFLPFGDCPVGTIDKELLEREISLVKSIDKKRPIMVTDSGELSSWFSAAKRADIFGTTLYRIIYKKPFGYIHYPLSPNFFRIKAWLIKVFVDQDKVIISELQAEPWTTGWVKEVSLKEQYKSMNTEKFHQIIDYAQKTRFKESYLWGVEWWYWLKEEQKAPQMWKAAKKIINKKKVD